MDLACSPRAVFGLLLACVAAECFYVASFAPFPAVDSAAHISSASTLAFFSTAPSTHLVDSPDGTRLTDALEWHLAPLPPNLIPGLVLAAIGGWLGYAHAETALVIGYVVCFALALYRALRQLRPGSEALAFFALPFTFSLSLLYGFYNFSWSLVLLLVFAGSLLRERSPLSAGRALLFSALLLVLYCTHLVGWMMACLLFGTVALARAWQEDPGRRMPALLTASLAALPTVVLAGWFLHETRSGAAGTLVSPLYKALRIGALEYGHSAYDRHEAAGFGAVALLFWTLAYRVVRRSSSRGWLDPRALGLIATLLLGSLIAVLGPEGTHSGASLLPPRLAAISALLGVLLLGYGRIDAREAVASMVLCTVATLWIVSVRDDELRAIESHQSALLQLAPQVRLHSTIVQANVSTPRFGDMNRLDPLTAEVGRLAAERQLLDLGNVDLALPYFPLRFKDSVNPYKWMVPAGRDNEDTPPPLDLAGYARNSGVAVDYVLLAGRAGADDALLHSRDWLSFEESLRHGFQLQATSSDGYWEIWAARPTLRDSHLVDSFPSRGAHSVL